jgi:hypothetical protein
MSGLLTRIEALGIKDYLLLLADQFDDNLGFEVSNKEFLLLRYHCREFVLKSEERGVDNDYIYRALADDRLIKTCSNYSLTLA